MNANSSSVVVMATHPLIGPLYWQHVHDWYTGDYYSLTADISDEDVLTLPSAWPDGMSRAMELACCRSLIIKCNTEEVDVPLTPEEAEDFGPITTTVPIGVFERLARECAVTASQIYDWFLKADWREVAFERNA